MSDQQLRTLDHELRANPDDPLLHLARARVLERLGREIASVSALDTAVRLGAIGEVRGELARRLGALAFEEPKIRTTFRLIPGGPFVMGAEDGDTDESPAHLVHLDPFFMAAKVLEVPYEQPLSLGAGIAETFERWHSQARGPRASYHLPLSQDYPQTLLSLDALGRYVGATFRLPTEAEWERVRRGVAVGLPYGIEIGLAWEWCSDFYDSTAYDRVEERTGGRVVNPRGPAQGRDRAIRGKGSENSTVPFVERPTFRDSASGNRKIPGPSGTADLAASSGPANLLCRLVRRADAV